MQSASGRALGSLNITDVAQALSLDGTLRGLPTGTHGVHLHMVGRCDAPAFESAGGHGSPTSTLHGTENAHGPHLGDLNNIVGCGPVCRGRMLPR
jgi:Cu-Zn family superoxide dismutase